MRSSSTLSSVCLALSCSLSVRIFSSVLFLSSSNLALASSRSRCILTSSSDLVFCSLLRISPISASLLCSRLRQTASLSSSIFSSCFSCLSIRAFSVSLSFVVIMWSFSSCLSLAESLSFSAIRCECASSFSFCSSLRSRSDFSRARTCLLFMSSILAEWFSSALRKSPSSISYFEVEADRSCSILLMRCSVSIFWFLRSAAYFCSVSARSSLYCVRSSLSCCSSMLMREAWPSIFC
mmetsp:Transcript_5318/g.13453  ORF Transcript_5318/g.13453 Transcript_5318/m.13453 type:complete len:237 (+) Transcript_5318:1032-1742(+)